MWLANTLCLSYKNCSVNVTNETLCTDNHTKHINTLCGQNVELLYVNLMVNTVTIRLSRVNLSHWTKLSRLAQA